MKVHAELRAEDKGDVSSKVLTLDPKTFSSGREGWYATHTLEVNGREVRVQIQAWERD